MDITPDLREPFPSGTRVAVQFPPDDARRRQHTIWIDGKCCAAADGLIAKWRSGELTDGAAETAIWQLRYGSGR